MSHTLCLASVPRTTLDAPTVTGSKVVGAFTEKTDRLNVLMARNRLHDVIRPSEPMALNSSPCVLSDRFRRDSVLRCVNMISLRR